MNYIFTNGHIYNHAKQSFVSASLLTENDIIKFIGTLPECRLAATAHPETIDLKGKLLLPSFTDTHTHFVEYAKGSLMVNLASCYSMDSISAGLSNYRKQLNWPAKWILGDGWDKNRLSNPAELNRHFLDKLFPDIPVALKSKDYHSRWCNSLALSLAGINQDTPDPQGGRIERFPDGTPNGILSETASDMMDSYIVQPSSQQIIKAITDSVQGLYKLGLTGFHSLESCASRDLMLIAQSQGSRFRLCWHFMLEDFDKAISEGISSYKGDEWFKPGGLKLFGDGSLGSQTAAMFSPYPSGSTGILRIEDSAMLQYLTRAAEHNIGATIHAIGDRSVRQAIEAVLSLKKLFPTKDLLHRLEHVQSIRNEDIPLLKASGMFAAVQPVHLANDVPMIEQYWNDIQNEVYSFGSMQNSGIPLCFGSDAPIESINPCLGIYSAIQRRPQLDPQQPQFRPDQVISPLQAINAYGYNAAQISRSEHRRGSLECGKLADIIVLDDFRSQPDEFWLNAFSHLTMISGQIVHNML